MAKHHQKNMKKRHRKLYASLDELVSCFYSNTGLLASNITLMEFMEWSSKMTKDPTCVMHTLLDRGEPR